MKNPIKVSVDLMDPVFVIGRGELVPITKTVVIEDGVSSYTTTKTGGECYLIDTWTAAHDTNPRGIPTGIWRYRGERVGSEIWVGIYNQRLPRGEIVGRASISIRMR
jgi:hypothetical protein